MENIEVRLFGPMRVRRTDGTVVQQGEWRTSKTMDLLRLLALNAGQSVTVSSILARLWPDVELERGRASLRTAASQLRKVLASDCLERRPGSMVLHQAWVDTQAYAALASEVDRARLSGEYADSVALVRHAEALYVDDIEVHETAGDWLEDVRQEWRERRLALLLDAADAAGSVNWVRDSLDFATQAAQVDRSSERAGRAMMRALAGLGEMEKALLVYERLRRDLAEQFGVDPSPQTRALHLQLLTGTVERPHQHGMVGNAGAVRDLASALSRVRREGDGCGLVWVSGEAGSGRESVIEAACRQLGVTVRNMNRESVWIPRQRQDDTIPMAVPSADVVVMPTTELVTAHAFSVLSQLVRRQGATLVVPVTRSATAVPDLCSDADIAIEAVEVPPLSDEDLAALAREVLQAEATEGLLRRLRSLSSGLAGLACGLLRIWLQEGRIIWTADGLDLLVGGEERTTAAPPVRRCLPLLPPEELDVLCVIAVADTELSGAEVDAMVTAWRPGWDADVRTVLDRLVERDLVRALPTGFGLAQRAARREILDWTMPATRRLLHRRVAETLVLDSVHRVRHWMAAGRYQLACDAGAGALAQACMEHDLSAVQGLLQVLRTLPPTMQPMSVNQPLGMYLDNVERELTRTDGGRLDADDVTLLDDFGQASGGA